MRQTGYLCGGGRGDRSPRERGWDVYRRWEKWGGKLEK